VICGDADGDGDAGRTSSALANSGGVDFPNYAKSETFLIALDFGETDNGEPDFIIGYPVAEAVDSAPFPPPCNRDLFDSTCFGLYRYSGTSLTLPQNRFRWVENDAALDVTPKAHARDNNPNPSTTRPGIEWTVLSFNTLRERAGYRRVPVNNSLPWSFRFLAFAGSNEDDGVGEDFMPASGMLRVEFSCTRVDVCGVCFGDGSSCSDCLGNPHGAAVYDQCGICGGDNTSCSDCMRVLHGSASYDECGVCNGTGETCSDATLGRSANGRGAAFNVNGFSAAAFVIGFVAGAVVVFLVFLAAWRVGRRRRARRSSNDTPLGSLKMDGSQPIALTRHDDYESLRHMQLSSASTTLSATELVRPQAEPNPAPLYAPSLPETLAIPHSSPRSAESLQRSPRMSVRSPRHHNASSSSRGSAPRSRRPPRGSGSRHSSSHQPHQGESAKCTSAAPAAINNGNYVGNLMTSCKICGQPKTQMQRVCSACGGEGDLPPPPAFMPLPVLPPPSPRASSAPPALPPSGSVQQLERVLNIGDDEDVAMVLCENDDLDAAFLSGLGRVAFALSQHRLPHSAMNELYMQHGDSNEYGKLSLRDAISAYGVVQLFHHSADSNDGYQQLLVLPAPPLGEGGGGSREAWTLRRRGDYGQLALTLAACSPKSRAELRVMNAVYAERRIGAKELMILAKAGLVRQLLPSGDGAAAFIALDRPSIARAVTFGHRNLYLQFPTGEYKPINAVPPPTPPDLQQVADDGGNVSAVASFSVTAATQLHDFGMPPLLYRYLRNGRVEYSPLESEAQLQAARQHRLPLFCETNSAGESAAFARVLYTDTSPVSGTHTGAAASDQVASLFADYGAVDVIPLDGDAGNCGYGKAPGGAGVYANGV
jgi:hypothetical protein